MEKTIEKKNSKTKRTHLISEVFFSEKTITNKKIILSGRIKSIREHVNFVFSDICDLSGEIQLKINKKNKDLFLKTVNNGDILQIEGYVCRTDKGVLSIETENFNVLSKCLKTIPKSHFGLKNIEERFRKRHLDFLLNKELKNVFFVRHKLINHIRNFLDKRNFLEIETPVLVSEASGANANPFITFHNKLKKNFYLRIATEIPLKKLIIGGFEKIYEIGKVFRNEGIDSKHNPEFTTIEVYQAYSNYKEIMILTELLIKNLAKKILKKKILIFNSYSIDIFSKFKKISMINSIKKKTGIDFSKKNIKKAEKLAEEHKIDLKPFQRKVGHIIYLFFEKYVEKELIQPTFIYDFPVEISPLSLTKKNNKKIAERFELYIGGIEFANAYSELNDPFEQKKRFEEQMREKKEGNEEICNLDKEFVETLEWGMPPTGGLGIGIDRLTMLFCQKDNIKEVIAFPQLRDKEEK